MQRGSELKGEPPPQSISLPHPFNGLEIVKLWLANARSRHAEASNHRYHEMGYGSLVEPRPKIIPRDRFHSDHDKLIVVVRSSDGLPRLSALWCFRHWRYRALAGEP